MRKLLIVAGIVLFSLPSFSQSHYISALVVNKFGDSLIGKIDYRNWRKNPHTIRFKSGNQIQKFNSDSINSFTILYKQESYYSYEVIIDNTPDEDAKAFSNHITRPHFKKEKVFLLQLIKSDSIDLYQYTDRLRTHFFYARPGELPTELIYHHIYNDSLNQVLTEAIYKQQLAQLTASCSPGTEKNNNVRYIQKEIEAVILSYIKCSNVTNQVQMKPEDPAPLHFGIMAGIMHNSFSFNGYGHIHGGSGSDYAVRGYKSNMSPLFGAVLDVGLKRNFNKMHIINELFYKKYKTSNTLYTKDYDYDYQEEVKLSFSYVQLNTLVRYFFLPHARIKPFIDFGMGNAIIIRTNQNYSHITYTNGMERFSYAIDFPLIYERPILFGVGINAKNVQVTCSNSFSRGFSPYIMMQTTVTSPHVAFTYQF